MVKATSFSTLIPVLASLLGAANAHTRVYSLWVNDVDQGDGRDLYIRSPPTNDPVKDVSSDDIICNVNNVAVAQSVSVAAGDKVTFEWYHDTRGDDIIASSHKGPITVYIADASTNGAGDVWTKIAEDGLAVDGTTWAVDTLIANKGKYDVTLPSALAAGDYLLRAEIIALHEADTDYTTNSARGAQFYPSCSQITVSGSGTATPPEDFGFVGGYSPEDPGILFSLYGSYTSYSIPGPDVWDGSSTGSAASAASSVASSTKAASSTAAASTSVAATTSAAATSAATTAIEEATSSAAASSASFTFVSSTAAAAASAPAATSVASSSSAVVTSAAPTTLVTKTRAATTSSAAATTSAASGGSSGSKTSAEINACLDQVNVCIAKAQSQSGGVVDFSSCETQRTACY